MKQLVIIAVCCLTVNVQSQSLKPTRTFNNYQPDSEQLFFSDNLPIIAQKNKDNANLREKSQQAEAQIVNDSYLLAQQQQILNNQQNNRVIDNKPYPTHNSNENQNLTPNGALNQNQNGNFQFQPSVEILPPDHTSQDYYVMRLNEGQSGLASESQVSGLKPELSRTSIPEEINTASLVISNIGIFMMKSLNQNQSNVVISPFSITSMLALLEQGAVGETQNQIARVLQMSPDITRAAYKLLFADLQKRGSQRSILKIASNIFAADSGFEMNRIFKNLAIQDFRSDVTALNFINSNLAARIINSWISDQTNGKIDELVSPDSINENTQLVLANAIYFKGLWQTKFKPEHTSLKEFHLSNGAKKVVPFMMMRQGLKCGFDRSANAMVVILPFENEQYSLVTLLPEANTNVYNVLSALTPAQLADYQNIRKQDVHLEIPKFTVKGDTNLNPILAKMGITKMFSSASELSNIGLYRSTPPQVSSAVHSAFMSVDEEGATAAASTVVAVVALSYDNPSIVFQANRPFVAIVWDNKLNLPLFMTQIQDPSL